MVVKLHRWLHATSRWTGWKTSRGIPFPSPRKALSATILPQAGGVRIIARPAAVGLLWPDVGASPFALNKPESLKLDDLGISISRYLDFFFIREGKPVEDKLIPLDERKLLKGRKPLDGPGYVDVLLHTGKFVKRTKGIGLEESLEETLFKAYPEQSLEEGLRSAGIDPRIVGRERMSRISKRFDRMLEAEECPCKGAHPSGRSAG